MTEGTATSTSLLQRAVHGEAAAWERLVELYGPLVYRWCRGWGLQPRDAENLGQDVFVRVLQALPTLRREGPGDSFRGWLYRIAYNLMVDYRRKARKQALALGGSEALRHFQQVAVDESSDADGSASASSDRVLLCRRAIDLIRGEFSDRDWLAFSRVVLDGATTADVAAELGVTTNVVYLIRSRVLRRLRDEFGDMIEF